MTRPIRAAARRVLPERAYDRLREIWRGSEAATVEDRLVRADARARMVARRQLGVSRGLEDRSVINGREQSVYSQNGEDGILEFLFSVVGTETNRFVEFGVGDGSECNGAFLALDRGWTGLMLEGDAALAETARARFAAAGADVTAVAAFVTADTINRLLADHGMQGEIDLLSVDVDGNDYWILDAIDVVRARIVVVEYNASFGPDTSVTIPYDPAFVRPRDNRLYHGASLTAFEHWGARRGYRLVGCDSLGVNAFFVRSDLGSINELPSLSPSQAWYPHATRLRRLTQAVQQQAATRLPLVDV